VRGGEGCVCVCVGQAMWVMLYDDDQVCVGGGSVCVGVGVGVGVGGWVGGCGWVCACVSVCCTGGGGG